VRSCLETVNNPRHSRGFRFYMSCTVCTFGKNKGVSSFATESLFVEFQSKVGNLINCGSMQLLNSPKNNGPFFSKHYKCNDCGQIWQLDYPDQAFRGGYREVSVDNDK
jgi:hypothetical protein